jgi:melibiase-like protein/alpha galactosidase C-like protein
MGGWAGDGRLRFQLDDERRWSLWYHGDGQPVPLITDATAGAWIGDRLVTLADLEDIAAGTRRPPGGDAIVVRGRAAGVYLEAEFLSGPAAPIPVAAVTLRIHPDRTLPTVKGMRFFQTNGPDTLPGPGPLLAHLNGYDSGEAPRVERLPADAVSHGTLGLTRESSGWGLALSFDPEDPGQSRVILKPDTLEAVSEWIPARPLRAEGDASTLRLALAPRGDGLDALAALFHPESPVDLDRLAAVPATVGWNARGTGGEAAFLAGLDVCSQRFARRDFRLIHLADGYQRAAGDWETNARYPRGHRWLTNEIHGRGFDAGLWLAPFAVTDRSGIPAAHPDWLANDAAAQNPIVWDTRDAWGGRVYALDGAHPEVREWLFELAHRVTREWGYDHVTIDYLRWAAQGIVHHGGRTHAEAYRLGLEAFRDGLGGATLLAAGAPLQHAVGLVDAMRIGTANGGAWDSLRALARAAALRSFYHRRVWLNDPDGLLVGPPLAESEARVWATVVAMAGGVTLCSDDLPALPAERLALLQRVIPPPPVAAGGGRPVRTTAPEGAAWVATGAPGWWTVALVNWEDEPHAITLPLASLGISGRRFAVYDVWRDAPLPDVTTQIAATIPPRTALMLALRAGAARPQVIGTTRHLIQGAVDVADETWAAATRTLSGRAVRRDGRVYRVTIAVPTGMRPAACASEPACAMQQLPSGHVTLEWPAVPAPPEEMVWSVRFRAVVSR